MMTTSGDSSAADSSMAATASHPSSLPVAVPGAIITASASISSNPEASSFPQTTTTTTTPPATNLSPGNTVDVRKLFVGGLSRDTTNESLRQYFAQYGEVNEALVLRDIQTHRSRGFGFVKYSRPEPIEHVLSTKQHYIDGKKVDVKAAVPKDSSMATADQRRLTPGTHLENNPNKIFVGGVSQDLTETDLHNYFESKYGGVTSVQIMMDKNTGRSRGFGFITFDQEDIVARIIADLDKNPGPLSIGEHFIDVKRAFPRAIAQHRPHPPHLSMGGAAPMGASGMRMMAAANMQVHHHHQHHHANAAGYPPRPPTLITAQLQTSAAGSTASLNAITGGGGGGPGGAAGGPGGARAAAAMSPAPYGYYSMTPLSAYYPSPQDSAAAAAYSHMMIPSPMYYPTAAAGTPTPPPLFAVPSASGSTVGGSGSVSPIDAANAAYQQRMQQQQQQHPYQQQQQHQQQQQ